MREIPLTRGMVALVDDDDYDLVVDNGPWHAHINGQNVYAVHSVSPTRKLRMHHLITGLPYVDHINGNGLDNRRGNLRSSTHLLNMGNQRRQANNTSGYKGVYRHRQRWAAQIQVDSRLRHLGLFETAEEAAHAYDREAIAAWGEFARVNFPENEEQAA